jgi:CheY-like chemotaxis protein
MVNMAAFWMCKLAPTEITSSDAFQRNQLVCREALTHDRASKVGSVSARRRVLRVLIVGDDQVANNRLVRLVSRWGHAACLASDGIAGLNVAAAQHPDVVLLDIATPHLDGRQVARQLRRDFSKPECFLIALTPDADERGRQRCMEAGIDLILIKPVEPSVLETLLMLECERVNRSRTDSGLGPKVISQFIRRKPAGDESDGAVEPRSRRAAGTARGRQP